MRSISVFSNLILLSTTLTAVQLQLRIGGYRSLAEEYLGGMQNRQLLVWSLLNVEELLGQVTT